MRSIFGWDAVLRFDFNELFPAVRPTARGPLTAASSFGGGGAASGGLRKKWKMKICLNGLVEGDVGLW